MMKSYIKIVFLYILLTSNAAIAHNYSSINYKIALLPDALTPTAQIDAEIKGEISAGNLTIHLPNYWAGTNYSEQIQNVKVNGSSKDFEIIKKDTDSETEYGHELKIMLPEATNNIKISYEIQQKPKDPSNVDEAIIRQDLIHSPGYGLFAVPADLEDKKIGISINWNVPDKWKTITSHSTSKSLKFSTTISQLLHSIYASGDLRIYQIADKKAPVFLSLYGSYDIKDRVIITRLKEIIKTQRRFFNDYDFPYYAISIIEGDNPSSMGGTRLHDSFTVDLPKNMDKKNWYIMFAHEHLHNWIGGKIGKDNTDALNYWWSEGFTEYYTRILALRSGGISTDEFIDEFNSFLKNYYLSPILNEPNSRIKKDFWHDSHVHKLPYYRGFVFAIYLNELIKYYDQNNSFDNVILDLLAATEQKPFSIELFKNIVQKYVPPGIDAQISDFIDQGKTIDLKALTTILPIEKIKMGEFSFGFDREAFLNEYVIKNIDITSNAYQSGLRNGDKITGYCFPKWRDPDQVVTVKTANNNFKFRPEGANKKEIYQIKPNLSSLEKRRIERFFGKKGIYQ